MAVNTYTELLTTTNAMAALMITGAGTQYVINTPNGTLCIIYVNDADNDIYLLKSTDYGREWTSSVIKNNIWSGQISVWYDRWSSIDADLIHIAYTDRLSSDVIYFNVNALSNSVSASVTVFAGTSEAGGQAISITRTRGGNLICAGCIDAGVENFCYKSTDVGANWSSIAALMESATQDQIILLPGWAADNQDAMCFFWDASANEISRKLYDDSADSWAESLIADTMLDVPATNVSWPDFNASVDITNSQNILVAWSATDAANADLRCWKVTEGAITEVTNVVLNSIDDQAYCALQINVDTNEWYVVYAGSSDGSQAYATGLRLYYKKSTDSGSTWGAETSIDSNYDTTYMLLSNPRFYGQFSAARIISALTYRLHFIRLAAFPRATYQLGM